MLSPLKATSMKGREEKNGEGYLGSHKLYSGPLSSPKKTESVEQP